MPSALLTQSPPGMPAIQKLVGNPRLDKRTKYDLINVSLRGKLPERNDEGQSDYYNMILDYASYCQGQQILKGTPAEAYKNTVKSILTSKGNGLSHESFFNECLIRHPYSDSGISLFSEKAGYELDTKYKTDVISHAYCEVGDQLKKLIVSGQIFYHKKLNVPHEDRLPIWHKEKEILSVMTHQQQEVQEKLSTSSPVIPSFVVTNAQNFRDITGALSKDYNHAVHAWEANGYDDAGPTAYLPSDKKWKLGHIARYYQKSLVNFLTQARYISKGGEISYTNRVQKYKGQPPSMKNKTIFDKKRERFIYTLYPSKRRSAYTQAIFYLTDDLLELLAS